MTLSEKSSYIKGLVDGLGLDNENKECKAINAIIDLLQDVSESMKNVEDEVDDLNDQVDGLEDKVDDVEDKVCSCREKYRKISSCNRHDFSDDLFDSDDSEGLYDSDSDDDTDADSDSDMFYELECPSCNTKVCLPEHTLVHDMINCPNCKEKIEVDLDECEECSCSSCDCNDLTTTDEETSDED